MPVIPAVDQIFFAISASYLTHLCEVNNWHHTCDRTLCAGAFMSEIAKGKYRILVVDDEPVVIQSVRSLLESESNIEVLGCGSAAEAVEKLRENPYRYPVVLMDYRLADSSGAEATKEILKINPFQIVAMNSGDQTREAAIESWRSGAVDFIEKKSSAEEIKTKILLCLRKYIESNEIFEDESSQQENRLRIEALGIAGASSEMANIARLIEKASNSRAPVLITGESGVGKDVIARAIHRHSPCSAMDYVAENMTAIPHEIFESTLFGHVKGSFTGAALEKTGLFKYANGGTLFLDEIGDMRLDQQVKLLRVLQSGEFRPVGSNKIEKTTARIIAATNVNLESAVANKTFREDLFYRLNIIRIHIPPLRERIEDIRPLVEHFRREQKKNQKVILMEVIRKFEKYPWPGNIRELYSELTRIFEYFRDEPRITLKHLDSKFFADHSLNPKQKKLLSLPELKEQHRLEEVALIKSHLKKHSNLRDVASDGLKIPFSTLHSKMKSFKLTDEKGVPNENER